MAAVTPNGESNNQMNLSDEELARFRMIFNTFDKDGGGSIDREELGSAMRSLGQNPTKVELDEMIEQVDEDGSGTIDFPEFLNLMMNKMQDMDTEEDLVEALSMFDTRKTGSVSRTVLQHALLNLGEKMTKEEVDFVFKYLPINESGKFNNEEIAKVLLS